MRITLSSYVKFLKKDLVNFKNMMYYSILYARLKRSKYNDICFKTFVCFVNYFYICM